MWHIRRLNKHVLALLLTGVITGAAVTWLFSFGLAGATGESDVVVTVNGQPISREAFYTRMEQEAGNRVLDQMISEALILSYDKVKVSDAEINSELSRIKGNYSNEADFLQALARYDLSMERLLLEIRMSLVLRKLASEGVTVSDDEIKAFFEQNKESLGKPEEVRASHILVDSKEEADKIVAQLKKDGDFASLAKQYSKDPGTANAGGDLGYITRNDQIVPEFKAAVFAMKVGEISEPVKTQFGYHVIKVTDKSPAQPANFDAQKEYIKAQLIEEKSRSYDDVIAQLRKEAKIQVNWDRYKNLEAQ